MGSPGEPVTQEGSLEIAVGVVRFSVNKNGHFKSIQGENIISPSAHERMMCNLKFGEEKEYVDPALSSRDLSQRFVGVTMSLLCREGSTKSTRHTVLKTCLMF